MVSDKYKDIILRFMPRVLTFLDRDESSSTYGCFDRTFWHYKFVTDYPCARYQEAVLALALVYKNNFSGNIYFNKNEILEYIKAGLFYWSRIQNKDGSFNEAYPNEHSFVTTSFSLYALTESFMNIKDELSQQDLKKLLYHFEKAANWLACESEKFVANHIAGASLALYDIYILTGNNFYKNASYRKLDDLRGLSTPEGWFKEYKGADIGYLTLTLDFLAKFYIKSKDMEVFGLLDKSLNFLKYFVHPDGTLGGDYGSRNTEFVYLCGLEILREKFPSVEEILSKLYLTFNRYDNLLNVMDDRYLAFEFPNFIEAYLRHKDFKEHISHKPFEVDFPQAGLFVKCTQTYYSVLGYKKGGVLKVFSLKGPEVKLVFSDSGYLGGINNGSIFTTQNYSSKFKKNNDGFFIKTKASKVKKRLPLVNLIMPFRIFNYTLCKIPVFAGLFSKLIKNKFFKIEEYVPVFLEKQVTFFEDKIIINEKLYSEKRLKFLKKVKGFIPQVTAASNYFQENLLDTQYEFKDIGDMVNSGTVEFKEEIII